MTTAEIQESFHTAVQECCFDRASNILLKMSNDCIQRLQKDYPDSFKIYSDWLSSTKKEISTNLGNLEKITRKLREDPKFILIISPEIDEYLEWVSQKRKMHKAQFVRESIKAKMLKDQEYQQVLRFN